MMELTRFGTATIHEALGQIGALPAGIKPIAPAMRLCGPALTVQTGAGDNLALHRALAETAVSGAILVAHCQNHYEAGYWGDIMSVAAQAQGFAGLIIDGCVRDADDIEALGFPVFARGLCIRGTHKQEPGTVGEPIQIGDIVIYSGDIVVGDRDGVVVVPQARLAEAIEKAAAREAKEAGMRRQLRAGKTTLELIGR